MSELWKDIPGLEGRYQASNLGRIRNAKTGKIRIPQDNGKGYKVFMIKENGKNKNYYIHRCVLSAFNNVQNSDELEVDHEDFNRSNNKLSNLRWVTSIKNLHHSLDNGRFNSANFQQSERLKEAIINGTNPFLKLSDESKEKRKQKWKSGYKKERHGMYGKLGKENPCSKPIIQYDLEDNFIKEWASGSEIQRELGYFSTCIGLCCRGKIKTMYGYKWKYK